MQQQAPVIEPPWKIWRSVWMLPQMQIPPHSNKPLLMMFEEWCRVPRSLHMCLHPESSQTKVALNCKEHSTPCSSVQFWVSATTENDVL